MPLPRLPLAHWVLPRKSLFAPTLRKTTLPTCAGEFGQEALLLGTDYRVHECRAALQHLSATAVRAQLASGRADAPPLDVLVPGAVASYISQHHLYQTPT